MGIVYHEASKEFHLFNGHVSYIIQVLRNNQLGQLYFGKRVPEDQDYGYLVEMIQRPMTSYVFEGDRMFSLEHIRQEYPSYGTTDYREPALEILQANGSRITNFEYTGHKIYAGKPKLDNLPAAYVEDPSEADTLEIDLTDTVTGVKLVLLYTIYRDRDVIARSARFVNEGAETCHLTRAMSLSLDLPDCDYDWMQFSGSWSRERQLKVRHLEQGIQSVGSLRGISSATHNPFVMLKRPHTDEENGEAMAFMLVYSGNFLAQAEVDTYNVTRVTMGIHPHNFDWCLHPGESFQTPEALLAYSSTGLNTLSQTMHSLLRQRVARGYWRDKERPVLINNWEATYFDFDEDKLVQIAKTAKECGVELFVLDDGWFSTRESDRSGLGDWQANTKRLPNGIKGLSERIEALGMKFGLWVELEMVNKPSDLYKKHPDWILHVPGRKASHGRYQYVLDFSRKEVVDNIHDQIAKILRESKVSYIKWDMNRSLTECYSVAFPPEQQGEIFHRYVLGVYDLYNRLTTEFPQILFESCSSGGSRFDAGMLYFAPQAWTSDDTDAVERMRIQYGTSYGYPVSSMGAHISITPNHQLNRNTPLKTRGDVAFFGAFGYELDLAKLTPAEREEVKAQIAFYKKYRGLIHGGTYYRLQSPFEGRGNNVAWMVVSEDKKQAVVMYARILNEVNGPYHRLQLQGLAENVRYRLTEENGKSFGLHYGSELENVGLVTSDAAAGEVPDRADMARDFESHLIVLEAE